MADPAPVLPVRVRLLRPGAQLPLRATDGATGLDIYACPPGGGPLEIGPDPVLVPTGIALEVPPGYDAQVRPRSGLAKMGVLAVFGTLDSDYRGELFITMHTVGGRGPHTVRSGDRIAQLVIAPLASVVLVQVATLSPTQRGAGGHGSTGA